MIIEFVFELKQKYTMMLSSVIIYFAGVDNGIFETHRFGKFRLDVFFYQKKRVFEYRSEVELKKIFFDDDACHYLYPFPYHS